MDLRNEFEVALAVDEAWAVLTDLERIAPCMPGAQLTEVADDEYRGAVKVKVGPITASYRGAARFLEQDAATHRAVLRATGRDTRGQGNAKATITASLSPSAGGTRVEVATDLQITGKVAQFGRGVLEDVSTKLMGQFVGNLERVVLGEGPGVPAAAPGAPASPAPTPPAVTPGAAPSGSARPGTGSTEAPGAEPIDLLDLAGGSVARRVAPLAVGLGIAVCAVLLVRRRRRR